MLRLPPSEIAIGPDDIRIVNERLDQLKRERAKGKIRLHPSPGRLRDAAVTSLHDRGILAYRAEVSSDEHEDVLESRVAQARARIGLGLAAAQLRQPSELLGISPRSGGMAHVDGSEDSTTSQATAITIPLRAQLDGQTEVVRRPVGFPNMRSASSTSQLLASRTFSAPLIPQLIVQAPTPRMHARQPMSDNAIAFDLGHADRPTRLRVPPSRHEHVLPTSSIAARTQRVMRVSFDSPPDRPRRPSPSEEDFASPNLSPARPAPQVPPPPPSPAERRFLTALGRAIAQRNGAAPPQGSRASSSSSSGSSSALEAAAEDRPSPLDSLSQQAAIEHRRIASRARQLGVRRVSPRTAMMQATRSSEHLRRALGSRSEDMPFSRARPSRSPRMPVRGQDEHGRMTEDHTRQGLSTRVSASMLHSPSRTDGFGPPHHSLFAHSPLPIRSREAVGASGEVSAPNASSVGGPPHHAIPPRHSSRLHTPMAPDTTVLPLPRTRPTSSMSPPHARLRAQAHLTPPPHPATSPRRNGAEIQRATALPIPTGSPEHIRTPPAAPSRHVHVPSATARARQRNQENSEEANMAQFRDDVATLETRSRENSRPQNSSAESGIMDDTPPRALNVERHLNGA